MKGWIKNNKFVPADPSNPYFYDAYFIINLDNTTFEYKTAATDDKFAVKKVEDDFQFPEIK